MRNIKLNININLSLIILTIGFLTPFLAGRFGLAVKIFSKYLFVGAIILVFGLQIYWAQAQYFLWLTSEPPARYLLPPYRGISYFFLYSYMTFFNKYAISWAAASIFLYGAQILNSRFQKRFFEEEEPFWGALAIFVLGQPLWLYFVPLVLGAGLLTTAFKFLAVKKYERFSLYYFWMPAALILYIAYIFLPLPWVK